MAGELPQRGVRACYVLVAGAFDVYRALVVRELPNRRRACCWCLSGIGRAREGAACV